MGYGAHFHEGAVFWNRGEGLSVIPILSGLIRVEEDVCYGLILGV